MKNITFDKSLKPDGPTIILIGKRDTGKSFLIKDLLYYHRSIPLGAVMSGTEAGNGFYGKILPKQFIHNAYNTSIVEKVLQRQKMICKKMTKDMEQFNRTNIDPRTFVIMDDCLYDSSWTRDEIMRLFFMNGRHWKVMLIITMQYPLGIPPMLRTNIDYVFILRENITTNRKRIYDNYAGMFPTFESFCQIMDQCTENYECLVIHNNAKTNNLLDQVFWYKADKAPEYKLGSKECWEISNNMGSDDDDDLDDYDPSSKKNIRGPKINVNKQAW